MKKIILIIAAVLLSIAITQFQVKYINQKTLQDYQEVYLFSQALEAGEIIEANDLTIGKINKQYISDNYIKSSDEIIGKAVILSVSKQSVVLKNNLQKPFETKSLGKGMAITSIQLTAETALCWQFKIGETLEVAYISDEGDLLKLGDVSIVHIFNEKISETDEKSENTYVVISAKQETVDGIVAHRKLGRLELIREGVMVTLLN